MTIKNELFDVVNKYLGLGLTETLISNVTTDFKQVLLKYNLKDVEIVTEEHGLFKCTFPEIPLTLKFQANFITL